MTKTSMRCPHCRTTALFDIHDQYFGSDDDGPWGVAYAECPAASCKRIVAWLITGERGSQSRPNGGYVPIWLRKEIVRLVRPAGHARPPCPPEVPPSIERDYTEACATLPVSPKASAALSRRCLQNMLRDAGAVKHSDLSREIDEVLGRGDMPSHIADTIDSIRNVGNYAAHPNKVQHTGEIVEVEPGEAEWCLEVLEELFDHYYVKPARISARRTALNQKLQDSGKPPMK